MQKYGNYGHWYEFLGAIDRKPGFYEIGGDQNGIVFQKNFRPIK